MNTYAFKKAHNIKVGIYEENSETFLSLDYDTPDGHITLHKIAICRSDLIEGKWNEGGCGYYYREISLQIPLCPLSDGTFAKFDYKEKPPKEMTISEIEKKLGYKIKIKGE